MNRLLRTAATLALPSPASEAVGSCLTDSPTGKDRKDLARWIFHGMAAHREVKDFANVTAAASEESSRKRSPPF